MEALSIQKREVLSDQKRENSAKLMKEDKRCPEDNRIFKKYETLAV